MGPNVPFTSPEKDLIPRFFINELGYHNIMITKMMELPLDFVKNLPHIIFRIRK